MRITLTQSRAWASIWMVFSLICSGLAAWMIYLEITTFEGPSSGGLGGTLATILLLGAAWPWAFRIGRWTHSKIEALPRDMHEARQEQEKDALKARRRQAAELRTLLENLDRDEDATVRDGLKSAIEALEGA